MLLGIEAHLHGDLRAPLDAEPGPLLFAGYLGGPLGGAIAVTIGSLFRLTLDSPLPVFLTNVVSSTGLTALGVLLRFVMPTPHCRESRRG